LGLFNARTIVKGSDMPQQRSNRWREGNERGTGRGREEVRYERVKIALKKEKKVGSCWRLSRELHLRKKRERGALTNIKPKKHRGQ